MPCTSFYTKPDVTRITFCATYAANIWNAQNFPFLSQDLFFFNGSTYNQLAILNEQFRLDTAKLEVVGLPWFAASNLIWKIGGNLAIGATISHVLIWYGRDIVEVIRKYRVSEKMSGQYASAECYPGWGKLRPASREDEGLS